VSGAYLLRGIRICCRRGPRDIHQIDVRNAFLNGRPETMDDPASSSTTANLLTSPSPADGFTACARRLGSVRRDRSAHRPHLRERRRPRPFIRSAKQQRADFILLTFTWTTSLVRQIMSGVAEVVAQVNAARKPATSAPSSSGHGGYEGPWSCTIRLTQTQYAAAAPREV
jgi:hypothetical protein